MHEIRLQVATERPSAEADASLYLHPQTLARLASFELRAKMIVEGLSSGLHRSPFQGFSVEFAQHRPYVPGDDPRHLDWRVFGRTDKLQIKQHQQETNLDLICLVDASGSMNFGSRLFAEASGAGRTTSPDGRLNWTKFDHATAIAAALSSIALRQGDRAGLIVFADIVRAAIRRSSNRGTWRQIVSALATHYVAPDNKARPTDLVRAIDQVVAKVTNHCLIAIVSDFFMDIENLRDALARAKHHRHDVIALQVVDRAELDFDIDEISPFEGLEGEGRLKIDPRAIRDAYLEVFRNHLTSVEKAVRSMGFDYQLVNTHDWLGPPIAQFVARRNAQLKRSKFG